MPGPQGGELLAFQGQFADQFGQVTVILVAAGGDPEGGHRAGGRGLPARIEVAVVRVEEQHPGQVRAV
jgi:hypothetical protein